jgi:DnaJ-class molecular chaperone
MDTNFTQLSGVDMYRTKDGKILIRTDGDVMTTAKVNAVTLMMGGWIKIKDFLDEEISVRVPAGMNPEAKMRVAGKGFAKHVMSSKHDSSSIKGRGALLISVIPTFDVKDVSIEAATSLLEKVKSENP